MQHNLYLFQPQYGVEYRQETTYWVPYSAGCLWSYASQFKIITDHWKLADLFFRREDPELVLQKMQAPSVCGFSCYIWNQEYCLTMASMIKNRWPECRIVFGGAQASGKLISHDFIDSIIMAEGEENFYELLIDVLENRSLKQFYNKKRLDNLDIPSPYTTGVFDKIMQDNPDALWAMVFETNRGCPYACTFCDWGGVTYSKIKKFALERVRQDLEWCEGKPISYLMCADANFGIFRERDLEIAKIIRAVADKTPKLDSVNLQYAKNSTDMVFEIAKTLGHLSRGITVSVQSLNDTTLQAIKRKNLEVNNIQHVMALSEQYGVGTYTEVILGLPLETLHSWKQGFADLLELGQHNAIDMWFAQLLDNSELSQPASRELYGIKSVFARDYMPVLNRDDFAGISESMELIRETNTMSTQEMIEGYMYGWMIIHFHIMGYSQLLAKYCRHRHGISYRDFYDRFFDHLSRHHVIGEYFKQMRDHVQHYLLTGEILEMPGFKNAGGHNMHAGSYGLVYENKDHAYALAQTVAESFGEIDSQIVKLQSVWLFDPAHQYPIDITVPLDITSWTLDRSCYRVEPKITDTTDFNFYRWRRQNRIKNSILKLKERSL